MPADQVDVVLAGVGKDLVVEGIGLLLLLVLCRANGLLLAVVEQTVGGEITREGYEDSYDQTEVRDRGVLAEEVIPLECREHGQEETADKLEGYVDGLAIVNPTYGHGVSRGDLAPGY